jgi:hypothetical protein
MDLPDNIFDDFDFNNDDNGEEVITSCNKVRKFTQLLVSLPNISSFFFSDEILNK